MPPLGRATENELLDAVDVLFHERYSSILSKAGVLLKGLVGTTGWVCVHTWGPADPAQDQQMKRCCPGLSSGLWETQRLKRVPTEAARVKLNGSTVELAFEDVPRVLKQSLLGVTFFLAEAGGRETQPTGSAPHFLTGSEALKGLHRASA